MTELASKMTGASVVVAGGAGFLGSALCRELLSAGAGRVLALDNFLHGVPQNVLGVDPRLELKRCDLLDAGGLSACLRGAKPDFVFNCVGDTFVPAAYELPGRFLDVNARACLNLLQICAELDIQRHVYVSSTEVYGDVQGDALISERTPLDPVNTYAVTKLAADRLCATMAQEHEIPVTIARIFNCYGPRESQPYIIPEICHQLRHHGELKLGNVDAIRDFTWVHDTARALIALAVADVPSGEAVNVGSGSGVSIRELCARIAKVAGFDEDLEIQQNPRRLRSRDIHRFVCDNARLKELTGWAPSVGLDEGLAKTWAWYADNGYRWSWENFVHADTVWR